jgi:hypothetical protein
VHARVKLQVKVQFFAITAFRKLTKQLFLGKGKGKGD